MDDKKLEIAKPVAWRWRFKFPNEPIPHGFWHDGKIPQNPYATFGSSWNGEEYEIEEQPLYASQPQGELREAGIAFLNEVESVSGKVNKRHRDAFLAALAGRTAG